MEQLQEYFKQEHGRKIALARAIGISLSAVTQWPCVPAKHVLAVEQHTGISRYVLRPDIFGAQEHQGAS